MNTTTILLDDALRRFVAAIQRLHTGEPLHAAFASWLCNGTTAAFSIQSIADNAASRSAGDRTFVDVAVLGYAVNTGITSPNVASSLNSGLDWVTGRLSTINGQPAGFCSNGIALLGIALGTKHFADPSLTTKAANWLAGFIDSGMRARSLEEWQKYLFLAAGHLLNVPISEVVTENNSTADVRVALRGIGVLPPLGSSTSEAEEAEALDHIRTPSVQADSLRAALSFVGLNVILRQPPTINLGKPSLKEVVSLLGRTEAALRRWTWEQKPRTRGATARQWHIDNEYHVQNLLWAMLSPIFPDLQDEVYTEAFGQLHPRIDLGIPSLKLIIEVKFVRDTKTFAEVVEEISADCGVYLSRPTEYKHIIPFIWDNAARVQEHDLLRAGLVKLTGIVDAVIVSRPPEFSSS